MSQSTHHQLARSAPGQLTKIQNLWQKSLPLFDLVIRTYLANVFFSSGMTKLRDWPSTLELFSDEYHVPLLSPELAAYSATGAELLLPILLVFGLARRIASLGLFALNLVAVISYYHVLQEMPAALEQHKLWGMLLILLSLIPAHYLSVDYYLTKRKPAQA